MAVNVWACFDDFRGFMLSVCWNIVALFYSIIVVVHFALYYDVMHSHMLRTTFAICQHVFFAWSDY